MRRIVLIVPVLLASTVVPAAEVAGVAAPKDEDKVLSGMSVLGNQEAPKSLVIVPWKSSQLGDALGIAPMLDDSRQPVDRDVFLRSLHYYGIRSESTRHDGAPAAGGDAAEAGTDATQPVTGARRRSS